MPTYEYVCRGCGAVTDATRPVADRRQPIECPQCGDFADLTISLSSFPHSEKRWKGRKDVNFEVDKRDEVARKQANLYESSGQMEKYFDRTKMPTAARKAHMAAVTKMIKKAPPIKVDL